MLLNKKSLFAKFTSFVAMSALILVTSFTPNFAHIATAASATAMKDTLSPATGAFNAEKASTVANHTIVFTTPTGIAAAATLTLTFDNSTSLGSIAFGDIDLADDGVDVALAAAPSGATWGVTKTGLVITFVNGSAAVAAASVITIEIGTNATFGTTGTNQITNGTAGTTLITIGGTFGDTGTIGVPIIADDVVVVNALVQPTITFTVSDNSIFYGNLRTAGICFAIGTDPGPVTCTQTTENDSITLTAGTNAASGYIITAQGATLTSGIAGPTITPLAANTASSPGTEQFGIRLRNVTGGSGTATAPYAAAGYAWTPTASTAAQIASASGPSASTSYGVAYMANIASSTEAGTYTANHTYVATATY